MFPLRDDNPALLRPYTTWALIALNVLAWVFVQGLGAQPALARSICEWGLIPAAVLGGVSPDAGVAIGPGMVCMVEPGVGWLTMLSSMFLHGGWFHLLGNMWFLWIFGDNVEDSMGHGRFLAFYLLCGLAAAALQMAVGPDSVVPMVGASGAIGGVMGAYVLLYPRVHVHLLIFLGFFITTVAVPAVFMLGYWFVLQLIGGFGSLGVDRGGVAFWAHVGGFAAGAVLVWVFRDPRLLRRHPYHGWRPSPRRSWRRL